MTIDSPVIRLRTRLEALHIELPEATIGALIALVDRLLMQRQNLTAIADMDEAIDRHLADSLVSLCLPEVAAATAVVDVGSGGGFPGIALAAALPHATVTLVESERKKCQWLERCAADFPNLRVVADRSEHLAAARRESWPLATARALAAPSVASSSPLRWCRWAATSSCGGRPMPTRCWTRTPAPPRPSWASSAWIHARSRPSPAPGACWTAT